jgi:hypothetical protein
MSGDVGNGEGGRLLPEVNGSPLLLGSKLSIALGLLIITADDYQVSG